MKNTRFDASYVITLPRMGRLDGFLANIPDWKFPHPQQFHGIDASRVPVPKWWTELPAMYGCNESHRAVIARALSEGRERVMIFEDDCRFIRVQDDKVNRFLEQVPDDWDGIMLGGQVSVFDGKTTPITQLVSKCIQVERLHAYGLSRSGMEKFYGLLSQNNNVPNDYQWGDAQQSGLLNVYRIEPFVCYQADGLSAITGRVEPARIWDDRVDIRVRNPETIEVISLVCPFEIMDQLRQRGEIANGGETPPQFVTLENGRVEAGELELSNLLMRSDESCRKRYVSMLRNDTAYHRAAAFVLWHPREVISFPGSRVIKGNTVEQVQEQMFKKVEAA